MRRPFSAIVLTFVCGCGTEPATTQALIAPPPPGQGFQVDLGPFKVWKPAATVPPGTVAGEVQLCRTLKLPNESPVAVNRIQVAMNLGSHHFILFRSATDFPDQIFPCWGTVNFDDWEFMIDVNRRGGEDWQLADGEAFVLQPHQQIMVQSHFLNVTQVPAPLDGMVTMNLYTESMDRVVHTLRGLFTVNTAIDIPPYSPYTTPTRICSFSRSVGIAAMTGHFHSRGMLFEVHKVKSSLVQGTTDLGSIYQSDSWDSPPFERFDPPMEIYGDAFAQGVGFRCSYYNDTDKEIGWGGHADTQEHCNLFLQYYDIFNPIADPLTCRQGAGGW